MNGYNFTQHVRHALACAREEAARLSHEYVGTEHVLLGLLRVKESRAVAILTELALDCDSTRELVESTVQPGRRTSVGPDLPYTSRAKKTLELAMSAARALGHAYVGTEHLLLGLLDEEKGIAAQVLMSRGVTAEQVRSRVGSGEGSERESFADHGMSAFALSSPKPTRVIVEIEYEDGTKARAESTGIKEAIQFLVRR